jgi:hypothetical protein
LEGNGFENHRIWEALYRGSIPILLRTNWSESLREYGFPLLYVDSIDDINQELLVDFGRKHANFDPTSLDALWVPFWKKIIHSGDFDRPIY